MISKEKTVAVQCRESNRVGYKIPDMGNLKRNFQPGEIKYITFEELFKLFQAPGGEYIIRNYLIIKDEEAVEALMQQVEPEYYYTKERVIDLMQNGSADEFEDCLNFAPQGVLEVIKDLAVSLPLNDIVKRDLILKKLDFNVANAIELTKDDEVVEEAAPKRKAATPQTPKKPVRKVVKPASAE